MIVRVPHLIDIEVMSVVRGFTAGQSTPSAARNFLPARGSAGRLPRALQHGASRAILRICFRIRGAPASIPNAGRFISRRGPVDCTIDFSARS